MPVLCWFRNDLRLSDNPALTHAVAAGQVIPLYILDDTHCTNPKTGKPMGGASQAWLYKSLHALNHSLGGRLVFRVGDGARILLDFIKTHNISDVYWNRCYEPWVVARDSHIKQALKSKGIKVHSYNGSLLWEPWQVHKADGTPYKVFTPFYNRGCANALPPRDPLPCVPLPHATDVFPKKNTAWYDGPIDRGHIESLDLLPKPPIPPWHRPMMEHWTAGESGAHQALNQFITTALSHYKEGRDFPAQQATSRLSPHLHFGEISPHQVWHRVSHASVQGTHDQSLTNAYQRQLAWREFSHHMLFNHPHTVTENLNPAFDNFPWQWDNTPENADTYHRWCYGQTGYPLIDAGMRELWKTGTMHNRVRMVAGSFLVKNLLLHWHLGERWFWDTLVDANMPNNSAGWQWIAGCGADAAPYYRIFNPVLQGEKFDGDGGYTRHWVPELKQMPHKYLHKPWTAPHGVLQRAGVTLGKTYPHPVVDLQQSRDRALTAYQNSKKPKKS